ncbi:MAG: 2-phospho-L-lactate transferase CofD family protein [archaeon]
MNIVIISGGTGSVAIETGLKKTFGNEAHITNILNAYDDGKSTGIVRKVFDVLGPSDIRKVQWLQWHNAINNDKRIDELYNNRYDFNRDNVMDIIEAWSFSDSFNTLAKESVDAFFDNYWESEVKNFNIVNIMYGYLFKKIGYEETISYFSNFLNITDNVVLNSHDNVNLGVYYNEDEECWFENEFIEFRDKNKKINDIFFWKDDSKVDITDISINEKVLQSIKEANMIIVSTGTEWSSLIPTLKFTPIAHEIDTNKEAVKIKVIDNEADGDAYGTNADEIIREYDKMIDMSNFIILSNIDANKEWQASELFRTYYESMDNIEGKHNPDKVSSAIVDIFLTDKGFRNDELLFDFDDTIWQRMNVNRLTSVENVELLNEIAQRKKVSIISGNSYESIREKIIQVFGSNFQVNFDIWAEGGLIKYKNDEPIEYMEEFMFDEDKVNQIEDLVSSLDIDIPEITKRGIVDGKVACVTIKPIHNNNLRKLLAKHLNLLFDEYNVPAIAKVTGFTTIDIFHYETDKKYVLNRLQGGSIMYVGDECDFELGNDYKIALNATNYYNVDSIFETNVLLKNL